MKTLTFLLLLCGSAALGQSGQIAHFSVWLPKSANFEAGYKQHLLWHKANNDKWNWYGWYIISGPRFGQFIDASFGHQWADFDKPVNPPGDEADNALHTDPFGDYLKSYKVSMLPFSDSNDSSVLRCKYLRMFTINVNNINAGLTVIAKAKTSYSQKNAQSNFLAFKMIDGGDMQQLVILIGCSSFEDYGKTVELQEDLIAADKTNVIIGLTAETLSFTPDMSINVK